MGSAKDPINIGIICLVCDQAIDTRLIPMLKTPATNVRFIKLKPADLHVFSPPSDLHAVILLHPFTEGRLSLTDVTDARYSKLLPILSTRFGSDGVCVIAYLIQNLKESTEQTHMDMVKQNQPTVFEMATCVILCGKLEELFEKNIRKIQEFMKVNWSNQRKLPWQNERIPQSYTEEELEDKQIQNPKPVEEQIHKETRSAKDKDDEAANTLLSTSSSKIEFESREPPPVVLVTDPAGFVGSHIVQQLTRRGYTVRGALDVETGTLESFEKGTLDNELIQCKIGMLKGLFPKLDLFEAGICHYHGWKKAVTGCSHVIHTSRFQHDTPAKEDDVTKLLHECELAGGIKRVVLTGGTEIISESELGDGEWKGLNSNLKDAICKHVSKKAALKFMGLQKEEELWDIEWQSTNIALKDAISKYISEKAASRFMRLQREERVFQLTVIKLPVVLGPILCEVAEANVELVSRRMENISLGKSDICIPVCDVRGVARAHIEAMESPYEEGPITQRHPLQHRLSLKDMTVILKCEPKGHGSWLSSLQSYFGAWDNMSLCLQDLYGNRTELRHYSDLGTKSIVIDMAYSCIERDFIPKMPGYRPREQGKRYREETTDAPAAQGADDADVDQRDYNDSDI